MYLLSLIEDRQFEDTVIPGWYVNNENLLTEEKRELFPNGYFNLSLSHGVAGILLALSIAYNKGICVSGQ